MRIGSVCTGIGGLDLGFERAGFEVAWMAEIDPWASRVLEKRWPGVPNVGDWTGRRGPLRKAFVDGRESWVFDSGGEGPDLGEMGCDLLIGGIPCQGHSVAGRREGKDDARNLWPAFAELVDALQPVAFCIENVPGLLTSNDGDFFAEVLEDCDRLGFSVEWDILSAAAVGAPHRRERVFIVGRRDGKQTWPQREQPSLFPGRPQSWPKAGRWTDGTLHERERQWPTPSGAAWPTPRHLDGNPKGDQFSADSGERLTERIQKQGCDVMLNAAVRMTPWPTPRTSDTNGAGEHGQGGMDLRTAVSNWTTPRAGDSKQGPSSTAKHLASGDLMLTDEVRLPQPASGRLSPDWTETLMGLPVGWTDPSCDEPEPRPYPWPMACSPDGSPLYGASPQAPWEPPRLVEPVKGDGRRHRLRCIGNCVLPAVAEVIANSIMRSFREGSLEADTGDRDLRGVFAGQGPKG